MAVASPGDWLKRVEAAFSLCLVEQPATDGDGASASASAPAPASSSSSSSSAGAGGAAAPRARALALAPLLSASELVKEGYAVLYSEGMISRTLGSSTHSTAVP